MYHLRQTRVFHYSLLSLILISLLIINITFSDATPMSRASSRSSSSTTRLCMMELHQVSVFKRKLNYQLWDSIEEPEPEIFAQIKVNNKIVFSGLLGEGQYQHQLDLKTAPFPCDQLRKRVLIAIFDQDKSQSMEIIGELTMRVKKMGDVLHQTLSGGAVRFFNFTIRDLSAQKIKEQSVKNKQARMSKVEVTTPSDKEPAEEPAPAPEAEEPAPAPEAEEPAPTPEAEAEVKVKVEEPEELAPTSIAESVTEEPAK